MNALKSVARTQRVKIVTNRAGPVFSYTLHYIVCYGLVEMAISTNQMGTIYRGSMVGRGEYRPWGRPVIRDAQQRQYFDCYI